MYFIKFSNLRILVPNHAMVRRFQAVYHRHPYFAKKKSKMIES